MSGLMFVSGVMVNGMFLLDKVTLGEVLSLDSESEDESESEIVGKIEVPVIVTRMITVVVSVSVS